MVAFQTAEMVSKEREREREPQRTISQRLLVWFTLQVAGERLREPREVYERKFRIQRCCSSESANWEAGSAPVEVKLVKA